MRALLVAVALMGCEAAEPPAPDAYTPVSQTCVHLAEQPSVFTHVGACADDNDGTYCPDAVRDSDGSVGCCDVHEQWHACTMLPH